MGEAFDAFEEMDAQLGLITVQEDMEKLKQSGVAFNSFLQQGDYVKGRPYAEVCIASAKKLKSFLNDPNRPKDLDAKIDEILRWIQPLLIRIQQLYQQQQQQQPRSPQQQPRSPQQQPPRSPQQQPPRSPQQQQLSPQQQSQQQPTKQGSAPTFSPPSHQLSQPSPHATSAPIIPLPAGRRPSPAPFSVRRNSPSPMRGGEGDSRLPASAPLGKILFPNVDSFALTSGSTEEEEEEGKEVDTTLELTIYQARFPHISHLPDWLEMAPGDIVTRVFSPDMDPIPGWEIGVSHRTGGVGFFPVAYADVVETGFQHSAMVRKGSSKTNSIEEKEEGQQGGAVTEISEETMKKMKKLNKQSSIYGVNRVSSTKGEKTEEKEKKRMGIAGDLRASMALLKPLVFKESGHDWDKPEFKMTSVTTLKKGASSKEKKKVKEEIEGIIANLNSNNASTTKVDLSGAGPISYSILKKLYASVRNNKKLVYLNLSGVGVTASQIQILEATMAVNRTLRSLDLSGNGFGMKELKLLESLIQKNYGLMEIKLFSSADEEKKELSSYVKNIDWYLQSNIEFVRFVNGKHTELRLCGRAIVSTLGWENYPDTTLLNASYNYLKDINPKIGSSMLNLVEINLSHNDISTLPYSFGQLLQLKSFDCSHNQIKELPSSMDRCVCLTDLNVANNKIRIFPHGILSLPKLDTVYAENNKCKIPASISQNEVIKFLLEKYSK